MTASLLTWILASLTVFWWVGLYQRVLGLRAVVLEGLVSVEQQLTRYIHLVEMQFFAEDAAPVSPQWAPLVERIRSLEAASQAARSKPFARAELESLAVLIDTIREQLDSNRMPQGVHKLWQEAVFSVNAARLRYNAEALRYNEALHQFPARLVVGLMGFKAAVPL